MEEGLDQEIVLIQQQIYGVEEGIDQEVGLSKQNISGVKEVLEQEVRISQQQRIPVVPKPVDESPFTGNVLEAIQSKWIFFYLLLTDFRTILSPQSRGKSVS